MRIHRNRGASAVGPSRVKWALLGASILAGGFASQALAQTAPAITPAAATDNGEVIVTGVRRSLTDAAISKRTATNFTDSIFAEDIGKFPDLNLAEALNRVPGVFVNRDIDGSGIQISVRGLGPSFSKILLNGAQIAVASDGGTDNGNSNREVDLDLFPTELFTKVTVNKTPTAELLEGGVAGTVDFVNARPFDNPGQHVTYSISGGYGDSSGKWSPRGALILSKTWDQWGVLIGYAGSKTDYRTDGFETIGWTTPNLSAAQCNLTTCNTDGGKGFSFPATVPASAGNGLTAGAPIDAAFLAAHNPGTTLLQLGNALMPRLGRDSFSAGTKDRQSLVMAFEYRPNDKLHASLDLLYGHAARDFNRIDMDWSLRNSNFMVPLNVKVDQNNVVTAGTFANAQFFLEARPYHEKVDFYTVNPSVTYQLNDWIRIDGKVNWNRSLFFREAPSFLFNSPQGITVQYANNGGDVPTITPSANLNDPNLGWTWNRVNIQNVKRVTSDKGTHWDATFGDKINNIKIGVAYDDVFREIIAFDGSTAYQNCVLNGTASTINGQVIACNAANQIPNAALGQYLLAGPPVSDFFNLGSGNPGYTKFIQVDYNKLKAATNYGFYNQIAPFAGSSATATPSGNIEEKTTGGYVELNGVAQFIHHDIYFNGGVRYFTTDQTVFQLVSINNVFTPNTLSHTYDAFLPSFNVAAHVTDQLLLRIAGSRSMTRPNPNNLLPGTTFTDPSAQVANSGNPNLQPYFSDNADLGLEWYTGGLGYLAANLFYKSIDGFTETKSITEPFSALGIPLTALSPTQQATGITLTTPIQVNQPVNIDTATLKGIELTWNQPLDTLVHMVSANGELENLVRGAGFTANYTKIKSKSASQGAALGKLPGIPSSTYNIAGYYERHNISVRVSYVFTGSLIAAQGPQNGVNAPLSNLITDSRGQYDLSASYTLPNWFGARQLQVVFNAVNMTNERIRTVFQFENAPYTVYYPGRQFLVGVRGKF